MAQSSGVSFDFGGIQQLAADLGEIPREVIPKVRQAVEVTARNIKEDWRAEAKKSNRKHARGYPSSVDYDMELGHSGEIGAEIGPDLGKNQGSFGFLEEAKGDVSAAPQGNARKALRNNLSDFEKGILKATEGLL
jgi:hypothetical protein